MTILELLKTGKLRGKAVGYKGTEIEALLGKLLNKDRVYLHMYPEDLVSEETCSLFLNQIMELEVGVPFHYVMGHKEWMGLDFTVTKDTLIPREDTRILLEGILSLKEAFKAPIIVEIGTGSGILPVLVKKNWEKATVYTVEISAKTLAIAKENFNNHAVFIHAFNGDFLEPIKKEAISCDILFSNPPYISGEEMDDLEAVVKKEPHGALFGGIDGLNYYRRLANEYDAVLKKGGYLLTEIGWQQGMSVKNIFEEKGLTHIATLKDDGNRDRVIIMQRN